jgi:multidrug efflux pump subunit AcrA (membrane-fusion protein)
MVRQGQLLFTIDPRPFAAALAEARAAVQGARSELAWRRPTSAARLRCSKSMRCRAATSIGCAPGCRPRKLACRGAGPGPHRAQLDVGFTQVRAPISGRISDRRIDAGNLVGRRRGGEEATLLTTINALDPDLLHLRRVRSLFLKARSARRRAAKAPSPVEVRLQDETDYRWRGRLDFTDNGLDTRSGTIRLRAVVEQWPAVPDARHVRQHAARLQAAPRRRCWCPTPRFRPTRRARS